jgi:hypothetical protein
MHSAAGCPADADTFYATMRGQSMSPQGQIIISTTDAGMSHNSGFDVFAQALKDFAADNRTTLTGQYDVTRFCIDSFSQESKGELTATPRFDAPARYAALGMPRKAPPKDRTGCRRADFHPDRRRRRARTLRNAAAERHCRARRHAASRKPSDPESEDPEPDVPGLDGRRQFGAFVHIGRWVAAVPAERRCRPRGGGALAHSTLVKIIQEMTADEPADD